MELIPKIMVVKVQEIVAIALFLIVITMSLLILIWRASKMDSVGLGQSWEEIKAENKKLKAEVDALESRVDELEEEKQDIMDNPEQHFDWGDLD